MFRREREREIKELNGGPPCGQVRVLVVGDSGVGKTSLVHLIVKGSSTSCPPQTIGCTIGVKHITYGSPSSSSSSLKRDAERDFFIELWDVSGHERYKDCPAGLPVPYIVIGNKADIASKEGTRNSSGNLVDVALQWVEKQGFLPSSEELPLTESFPGSGGLIAADKEGLMKFFRMLIKRRYFPDDVSTPNTWSISPPRTSQRLDENSGDNHWLYKRTSLSDDPYKYNMLPPLPAQHNLTPPPTLYPQQPVSATENYNLPRLSFTVSQEINSSARSKRADINV